MVKWTEKVGGDPKKVGGLAELWQAVVEAFETYQANKSKKNKNLWKKATEAYGEELRKSSGKGKGWPWHS